MTISVFTAKYRRLCILLAEKRKEHGLTQSEVAMKLKRPQSFVSKYENAERRLDVVEFLEIAAVLNVDPRILLSEVDF